MVAVAPWVTVAFLAADDGWLRLGEVRAAKPGSGVGWCWNCEVGLGRSSRESRAIAG